MLEAEGPNAQQIQYWNEVSGPKWVRLDDAIHRRIASLGNRAIERAGAVAGERALDVGCGCGQTTFALGARVGDKGRVTGVDISTPMLESARARGVRDGVANVEFVNADAQTYAFEEMDCDLIFSRFGVMFFSDRVAAFRNLRTGLGPGGRLVFACWREMSRNPWIVLPSQAVAEFVEVPPREPDAPGPFSLADSQTIHATLEAAGYSDIQCESVDEAIDLAAGSSLDDTVAFASQMGPAGGLMRDATPEIRRAATEAIRERLAEHHHDGRIELGASIWLVTAVSG